MYKQFYLMEKEPFDIHPSPELFYKSNAHQNGWGYLFQGIKANEPILLVTGEYGTGKTLLCLRLVQLLKALKKKNKLPSVYLSTPTYDFSRVLEKIIVELNISMDGVDASKESKLQQLIYDYFEASADSNKKNYIYLVIDDAQDFNYSFVNKLRLLCSYNVVGEFPIRLILFAHQDFFGTLNDKKNAAMAQRIRRIYRLRPFEFEETREYIYFRLTYSGASGAPVFDDDAIELIQNKSRGVPRLINNICDNCLLVASNERLNQIDAEMVTEAMEMGNMVGVAPLQEKERLVSQEESVPVHEYEQHEHEPVDEKVDLNPLPRLSGERITPAETVLHNTDPGIQHNHSQEGATYGDQQFQVREDYHVPPYKEDDGKDVSKQEDKKKDKKKGWEYIKMGVIFMLIVIILYLIFYIFTQNSAGENKNLQSLNGQRNQIILQRPLGMKNLDAPKRRYAVLFELHTPKWQPSGESNNRKDDLNRQNMDFEHGNRLTRQGETQCEIG